MVALALLISGVLALLGFWGDDHFGVTHNATSSSGEIALTCAESVGQQGRDGGVVNGVTGLNLPGSGDPGSLALFLGPDGRKYYVYKALLAVSSSDAPFATVSILDPPSARLYYGPPLGLNQTLVLASKKRVRLPVCGPRFSGYPGGVVLEAPSRVSFQVTTPRRHAVRVEVSIGDG